MCDVAALTPVLSFNYLSSRTQVYKGDPGQGLPIHQHEFAHLTVCIQGSIKVLKQKGSKILTVNDNPLLLTANEWHEIEIVEPNTIFSNIFEAING
jgi:quercetin dioxygenase-like cupin family protein